jgi:glutamyl-tRNA reductase
MNLIAAGISYKTAPVNVREQLAVKPSQFIGCAHRLKEHGALDEAVVVSTCNRVEIYGTTRLPTLDASSLFRLLRPEARDYQAHIYVHQDIEAARHLFRVAAGLDSMVLGETEITGQIKKAYEFTRAAQATRGVLNRVFQKAFQVAKEIRTRTGIGRGATSVGSVAGALAEKIFGNDLTEQVVIIIGAGAMGEACVRHLAKKGARSILVSNRSFDRAVELAGEFSGLAVSFEERLSAVAKADVVVTSTGCPKTLIHRADVQKVMEARQNRPLILIDIAVPRNVEAAVRSLDNVYLYNIDDLQSILSENMRTREQHMSLCDLIVEERAAALMEKLNSERVRIPGAGAESCPDSLQWAAATAARLGQLLASTRQDANLDFVGADRINHPIVPA